MAVSVGFIGVGNMGNPMAGNVLKAGFPMTVFDKSAKAMDNLVQAGARAAASMADVAERSEIVLTCLPASPDVEALYLEPGGLIDRAKAGTILIDLSSVLPSTPRKLEPRAKARGVHFLEAPVSGGTSAPGRRRWRSWWAATRTSWTGHVRCCGPSAPTSSASAPSAPATP